MNTEDYGHYKVKMGDGFTTAKYWTLRTKGTFVVNHPTPPNRNFFYVDDPVVAMLRVGEPIMIKCEVLPSNISSLFHELKQMEEMYDIYRDPELGVKIQWTKRHIHDNQQKGTGAIRYILKIMGKRIILNKALEVAPKVGGSVTRVLGYSREYIDEKATEEMEKINRQIRGKTWV